MKMIDRISIKVRFTVLLSALTVLAVCLPACSAYSDGSDAEKGDTVIESVKYAQLTQAQAEELYVGDVDWPAAKSKGLAEGDSFSDEYLQAAAAYLAVFNYYLGAECDFDEYQRMLDGHPWSYPADEVDEAVKAQGAFGRNNLYIRNTAYVERLDADDLKTLRGALSGGAVDISEKLVEIVSKTYRAVLEVRDESGKSFNVIYKESAISSPQIASGDALVILLHYEPEFTRDGMLADEEIENQKDVMAQTLKDLMESELSEKLDIAVSVFIEN